MQFSVTLAVVLVACAATGICLAHGMGRFAEDAQTTTTNAPQVAPQATNASVPASVPVAANGSTLPTNPKPNATLTATKTPLGATVPAASNVSASAPTSVNASTAAPTSVNASAVPNASIPLNASASKGTILPSSLTSPNTTNVSSTTAARTPVNGSATPTTSMPVNASKGTSLPTSSAVPNPTNASSTTLVPVPVSANGSTVPNISVMCNVPAATNVTMPTNASEVPGNLTVPEVMNVAPAGSAQPGTQQNTDPTEAMAELMKNLDVLTGLYTKVPSTFGFLSDAEEKAPASDNDREDVQKPLEEFKMCTLTARLGDERGPMTVIVAAEDEERMRASGSYYQVSDSYEYKHRTFISYCPGREDIYLTFNPRRSS